MTFDDKIRDEKLQYIVNREVRRKSALSSGKIEEILKKYFLLIKVK